MSNEVDEVDPAIMSLFNRLPAAGETWPMIEREKWLRAMECLFDVVYKSEDREA